MNLLQQISQDQVRWQNKILSCKVGRNGFANLKLEGDGCTPTGKWQLLSVYYRPDRLPKPITVLPVVAITPDLGWSDDPTDPLYNSLVKITHVFSHEGLWRDDHLYDIFITISHNTNPIVVGQGSAIFIHSMHENETPTAGCLALKLPDLQFLITSATRDTYWNVGEELARIT
jgi:L,D-peptidoglycan transpeptidase YkuD (ErfK/YbiS/YcfS/YnhG family)